MSAHSQQYVFFPCLLYNHRFHGGEFKWCSVAQELSYSFSDVCLCIPEESLNKLPIQQPPPVSTSKGGNGSVLICKKDPHQDAQNSNVIVRGSFLLLLPSLLVFCMESMIFNFFYFLKNPKPLDSREARLPTPIYTSFISFNCLIAIAKT